MNLNEMWKERQKIVAEMLEVVTEINQRMFSASNAELSELLIRWNELRKKLNEHYS